MKIVYREWTTDRIKQVECRDVRDLFTKAWRLYFFRYIMHSIDDLF